MVGISPTGWRDGVMRMSLKLAVIADMFSVSPVVAKIRRGKGQLTNLGLLFHLSNPSPPPSNLSEEMGRHPNGVALFERNVRYFMQLSLFEILLRKIMLRGTSRLVKGSLNLKSAVESDFRLRTLTRRTQ